MKGKTDEAVSLYLRLNAPSSSTAITQGKDIHESVGAFVKERSCLPDFLPPFALHSPESEKEVVVSFNEMFTIKGVFDILDGNVLYELKTGLHDSCEWSSTLQVPFYFLISKIASIPIDRCYLIHFNQYEKTNDWCLLWNNQTAINRAINLIESVGPEIYTYFDSQGLL